MNKQQKIKQWNNIFEQQQRSDSTTIQFCRDNKVNVSTFYAWRKLLLAGQYWMSSFVLLGFTTKPSSFFIIKN